MLNFVDNVTHSYDLKPYFQISNPSISCPYLSLIVHVFLWLRVDRHQTTPSLFRSWDFLPINNIYWHDVLIPCQVGKEPSVKPALIAESLAHVIILDQDFSTLSQIPDFCQTGYSPPSPVALPSCRKKK